MAEPAPQSFIVKIWIEETADESGEAAWRGHITHVPSGDRRYLHDLHGITAFIAPYLAEMGVRVPGRLWRKRRWTGKRSDSGLDKNNLS